jgi:hypothetical protein
MHLHREDLSLLALFKNSKIILSTRHEFKIKYNYKNRFILNIRFVTGMHKLIDPIISYENERKKVRRLK